MRASHWGQHPDRHTKRLLSLSLLAMQGHSTGSNLQGGKGPHQRRNTSLQNNRNKLLLRAPSVNLSQQPSHIERLLRQKTHPSGPVAQTLRKWLRPSVTPSRHPIHKHNFMFLSTQKISKMYGTPLESFTPSLSGVYFHVKQGLVIEAEGSLTSCASVNCLQ